MKLCRRGHTVDGENKLVFKNGRILCKACTNAGYNRRYRARSKGARLVELAEELLRLIEAINHPPKVSQTYINGLRKEVSGFSAKGQDE